MPITSISLGGQPVHTTTTAILDSGTNVLLVPTPIFSSFRSALKSKSGPNSTGTPSTFRDRITHSAS